MNTTRQMRAQASVSSLICAFVATWLSRLLECDLTLCLRRCSCFLLAAHSPLGTFATSHRHFRATNERISRVRGATPSRADARASCKRQRICSSHQTSAAALLARVDSNQTDGLAALNHLDVTPRRAELIPHKRRAVLEQEQRLTVLRSRTLTRSDVALTPVFHSRSSAIEGAFSFGRELNRSNVQKLSLGERLLQQAVQTNELLTRLVHIASTHEGLSYMHSCLTLRHDSPRLYLSCFVVCCLVCSSVECSSNPGVGIESS